MMDGQSSSHLQDAFLNILGDMLLLPLVAASYRKIKLGNRVDVGKPSLEYNLNIK